jgi:predicted deacylase
VLMSKQTHAELIYFDTYEDNRKAFLELSQGHTLPSWPLLSDTSLTTDLTLIQVADKPADSLVVLTSGLHGIEGYVGSSVQRWLLTELKNKKNRKSDVLLIHALNPWGMKNKRRVNENNIDLNRNFALDPDLYRQKNPEYTQLNSFLNPEDKVDITFFYRLNFIFKSLQYIYEFSLDAIRKSILLGQYNQPKGIYFGGLSASELKTNIDNLFEKELKTYKKILWIDLHTGYGEKGKLHLLSNDSNSETGKKLQKVFLNEKIDFGNQKNFYKTTGDLDSYIAGKSNSQQDINAITFEYGTMNSQNPLASIESLRRMIVENQGYQVGFENLDSQTTTYKQFEELFYPKTDEWKKSILEQTQRILEPLL